MKQIDLQDDVLHSGMATASVILSNNSSHPTDDDDDTTKCLAEKGVRLDVDPIDGEDVFAYMRRIRNDREGDDDEDDAAHATTLYCRIVGAANEFKEGDLTLGVAAADEITRRRARRLLAATTLRSLQRTNPPVHRDALYDLIVDATEPLSAELADTTLGRLKTFVSDETTREEEIKLIMPQLNSDTIACLVKLMSNEELIAVGRKVFNPLPGSNIGSKGYLSARIQPNSPTDNTQDITWQVLNGWSYAVGDLVLGCNPVSSRPDSVAAVEAALHDVRHVFGVQDLLSHCVLSHIDVQAEAERRRPGTTGIWFQSLAGTVAANRTFDVTADKMRRHVLRTRRHEPYGLYGETGQGADFTNGHGAGFDMVVHEGRKYGFLRALRRERRRSDQWMHVNDVAGFIGPEVFKSREQLVRCCLEDTVMGKLHGLTIGLDICSTLHMDVTLDDLDWCIERVMPANPAYLMALPTKNDPMLSYLTTSFSDHVRIREKFGYKVNDKMWDFFHKQLEVIDDQGNPTEHFGQPLWVYYKYRQAKGDVRSREEIYEEGRQCIKEIEGRGVPIAQGYGENVWDPPPALDGRIRRLYEDSKVSLWTEFTPQNVESIPASVPLYTKAKHRQDYVYHPESGEHLGKPSMDKLLAIRQSWGDDKPVPDVQVVISDGLNARALTDEGHLLPFLQELHQQLRDLVVSKDNLVITNGRVRAGYQVGETLFGVPTDSVVDADEPRAVVHLIGERPGSGHHNFSAYLTALPASTWGETGTADHNHTRVVSGISDTAFHPVDAARQSAQILRELRVQHTPAKGSC